MTVLLDLLLGPVTLPVRGISYVLRRLAREAEREFSDPVRIQRALLDLQQRVDDGTLTPERFEMAEAILLRRLDTVERHGPPGWMRGG
jgi:Gas vesicle protein G